MFLDLGLPINCDILYQQLLSKINVQKQFFTLSTENIMTKVKPYGSHLP